MNEEKEGEDGVETKKRGHRVGYKQSPTDLFASRKIRERGTITLRLENVGEGRRQKVTVLC